MRVVVALGGNALLQRGDKPDASVQLAHVRAAAEQDCITGLLDTGAVVICGVAAVTEAGDGQLAGVEALVDKDFVAAMLGSAVAADRLLVLTDVAALLPGTVGTTVAPTGAIAHEPIAGTAHDPGSRMTTARTTA